MITHHRSIDGAGKRKQEGFIHAVSAQSRQSANVCVRAGVCVCACVAVSCTENRLTLPLSFHIALPTLVTMNLRVVC